MYGAIIGDIVGSVYEFNNIKTKKFPLFTGESVFTDDSIMTVAVAKALVKAREEEKSFKLVLTDTMREYGRLYPNPKGGYGGRFAQWLWESTYGGYNSFGNGSAMRVSPCGLIAVELQEALELAKASAEVTHNHPEGIKGAQAVAAAIYMAKVKKTKAEIKGYIKEHFYNLDFKLAEIRDCYKFNETCQETVPQAIVAFLESNDFEDAIRNAISLGGDSDTLTAITGSIAWTYYRDDNNGKVTLNLMRQEAESRLPKDISGFVEWFSGYCVSRADSYKTSGNIQDIPL